MCPNNPPRKDKWIEQKIIFKRETDRLLNQNEWNTHQIHAITAKNINENALPQERNNGGIKKGIKASKREEKVDFLAKQAESPEATGTTGSDLENNIKLTMVFRPIFYR